MSRPEVAPLEVIKRSGEVVPFDAKKIESAFRRCFSSVGVDADPGAFTAALVESLDPATVPSVERIQDAAEATLLRFGQRSAAQHYMSYRDEHARRRALSRVSPEIRSAFAESSAFMGNDPIRCFQFFDKYARWKGDSGRRETWIECVDRAVEWMQKQVKSHAARGLDEVEWAEIRSSIRAMESMPSMRLLSQAGESADRDNVSIFNCAYQAVDDPLCFGESLSIAMAGCGDAYSVESQFVRKLPFVRYQRKATPDLFIVPDTSQGWVEALMFGVNRWFEGHDAEFDFSELRPAGAVLRTKGGQASGAGPLRSVLSGVRGIMLSRQGSALRPIDANDIMCVTGEAGNSGGMRRTAKLSLSDWGDTEMRDAKSGSSWFTTHGFRENANNSAAWPDGGPTMLDLMEQMGSMFRARSGERGIFSRENALRTMPARRAEYLRRNGGALNLGTNPCGEIYLQSRSFCNLSQAIVRPTDDFTTLARKVRIATILGTIQSMCTYFPNLRADWSRHAQEERLLGVDLPGQMDHPILSTTSLIAAQWLTELREIVVKTNAELAARFGIEPSMSPTCTKPSGNSSLLINAAPGQGARKIRYGIRNARVNTTSPIFRLLQMAGVPMDPENGQEAATATKWVIHFPMRAPDGAVTTAEQTAVDQLNHWLLNKNHWTTHNPSCTIEYGPDELLDVVKWVWDHRNVIGGLSFLPKSETVYRQLPYEETTEEEYERALAAFPAIDWSMITALEVEDHTTSSQELACAGGACSLDDRPAAQS